MLKLLSALLIFLVPIFFFSIGILQLSAQLNATCIVLLFCCFMCRLETELDDTEMARVAKGIAGCKELKELK